MSEPKGGRMSELKLLTGEELLDQFRNLLGRVIFDASLQGKLTAVEKEILKRMSLDLPGDEEIEKEAKRYTTPHHAQLYRNGFVTGAKWLRSRIGGGR